MAGDGHTINIGMPDHVGEPLAVAESIDTDRIRRKGLTVDIATLCDEVDRLRAENVALAAALADIAGMLETGGINDAWVASAECACMGTRLCYERWPGDPGEWCSVCVAEVAWCAWKMGALR